MSLYTTSTYTGALLKQLSEGRTVARISEDLKLTLSPKLAERIGTTTLGSPLAYRPVAYLLNRDARDRNAPSSPHGGRAHSAHLSLQPIRLHCFALDRILMTLWLHSSSNIWISIPAWISGTEISTA